MRTLRRLSKPGRFPMTIIQHSVWLYHRFPFSFRDAQMLLHQRGIQVSHETLRGWCIKFDTAGLLGSLIRAPVARCELKAGGPPCR